MQSWKTLYPLVNKRSRIQGIFLLVLSLTCAVLELALAGSVALLATFFSAPEKAFQQLPTLIQPYFSFVEQDVRYGIFSALILVVALVAIKNSIDLLLQWKSTRLAESIGNTIRLELMDFFMRAPYVWVLKSGTSDMLFGLDAARQMGLAILKGIQIFNHLLILILFLCGMFAIAFVPTLLLLGILGLSFQVIIKGLRRVIDANARRVYATEYNAHSLQQLSVQALKEVRIYRRENALLQQYRNCLTSVLQSKSRQGMFTRLPVGLIEILGFISLLAILAVLIWVQSVSVARITVIMGFMATAAWRLLPIANRLMEHWTSFRASTPYLAGAARFIQEKNTLRNELISLHIEENQSLSFNFSITFHKAYFSYPGTTKPALNDVSFTIPKGSMVGIVGLSGAGKSTLINLLAGLFYPSHGNVCVDETPITLENTPSWLAKIGYISQTPYILNATLAENIALSRWGETIDRERVVACCHMAALDFLEDLVQGIDTPLGERGTRLSGGQAQRVVIARALYNKPELVIFDEATSSLDMKNERAIHETILSLRNSITLVIIAHRLSAVEGCDQIVWMEKGRIRMAGAAQKVLPEYGRYIGSQQHQSSL